MRRDTRVQHFCCNTPSPASTVDFLSESDGFWLECKSESFAQISSDLGAKKVKALPEAVVTFGWNSPLGTQALQAETWFNI